MHIWGAYYIVLWYGQTIEEMFAVFSSFCCYLVDKLIYIIYELYDKISLLHLLFLKVYVTSSYLVYQTQCSHYCPKDASL